MKTAAVGVRRVEGSSTLEVFTGLPQGVRASPYEGIKVEKLRRYSTFVVSLKESTRSLCRRKVRVGFASAGVGEQVLRRNT
jgi:hypothetical protein